ncbi:MAG TPA: hypothetical protein VL866_21035 [Pyrinomonadaceae bacterium]|nr:hypothetical protein [Pyrinomonadaceae bacterium]
MKTQDDNDASRLTVRIACVANPSHKYMVEVCTPDFTDYMDKRLTLVEENIQVWHTDSIRGVRLPSNG